MIKTNTTRKMSVRMIEKSFDDMIIRQDVEMLVEFMARYPHFTELYTQLLLKKIELISMVNSELLTND